MVLLLLQPASELGTCVPYEPSPILHWANKGVFLCPSRVNRRSITTHGRSERVSIVNMTRLFITPQIPFTGKMERGKKNVWWMQVQIYLEP